MGTSKNRREHSQAANATRSRFFEVPLCMPIVFVLFAVTLAVAAEPASQSLRPNGEDALAVRPALPAMAG